MASSWRIEIITTICFIDTFFEILSMIMDDGASSTMEADSVTQTVRSTVRSIALHAIQHTVSKVTLHDLVIEATYNSSADAVYILIRMDPIAALQLQKIQHEKITKKCKRSVDKNSQE